MMDFIIPGEPQAKQRPRINRRTMSMYTPSETKAYENKISVICKYAMLARKAEPAEGPIRVLVAVYKRIPKSASRKQQGLMASGSIRPMTRPDLDNVVKIVLDGMNKVAYKDDRQVVAIQAMAQYSQEPRVEVTVEEVSC